MSEALAIRPTWSQRVREFLLFASFFFNPSRRRASAVYELRLDAKLSHHPHAVPERGLLEGEAGRPR
jgi:hypothetical protein